MWMTHGEEDGTYEQRDEMQRSSGRLETTPGAVAGNVDAESLVETVH
jgi:hypothetical protein